MAGQRDPSQTIMTVSISKRALAVVDEACRTKARGATRAQFVRDALQFYLKEKHGIILPDEEVMPPARGEVLLPETTYSQRSPAEVDVSLNELGGHSPRVRQEVVYQRGQKPRQSKTPQQHKDALEKARAMPGKT